MSAKESKADKDKRTIGWQVKDGDGDYWFPRNERVDCTRAKICPMSIEDARAVLSKMGSDAASSLRARLVRVLRRPSVALANAVKGRDAACIRTTVVEARVRVVEAERDAALARLALARDGRDSFAATCEAMEARVGALRAALIATVNACPGAGATDAVSDDFLMRAPDEVRGQFAALTKRVAALAGLALATELAAPPVEAAPNPSAIPNSSRAAGPWAHVDWVTTTRVRLHNGKRVAMSAYVSSGRWQAWLDGVGTAESFDSQAQAENYADSKLADAGWTLGAERSEGAHVTDLDAVRAALATHAEILARPRCGPEAQSEFSTASFVVIRAAPALLAEIDRLRARVAEVEGERNEARRDAAIWQGVAERERERVADALEELGDLDPHAGWLACLEVIRALPAPEART